MTEEAAAEVAAAVITEVDRVTEVAAVVVVAVTVAAAETEAVVEPPTGTVTDAAIVAAERIALIALPTR